MSKTIFLHDFIAYAFIGVNKITLKTHLNYTQIKKYINKVKDTLKKKRIKVDILDEPGILQEYRDMFSCYFKIPEEEGNISYQNEFYIGIYINKKYGLPLLTKEDPRLQDTLNSMKRQFYIEDKDIVDALLLEDNIRVLLEN